MSDHDLSLNPRARPSLSHLGNEREPLLQVDDLLSHPEALVDYAASQTSFTPAYGPAGGYPGLRAPAPLDYVEAVARALDPMVRRAFALDGVRLSGAECNFSLVTLPPEALAPAQREPHVDTDNPLQFAFLHYLCGPGQGGTAFYRHRATGFESLSSERLAPYRAVRAAEGEEGPGYIRSASRCFDRIGAVDAAMNRLVVYRSRLLHSGQIPPQACLSPDPRQGRLTANIFLTYRPG